MATRARAVQVTQTCAAGLGLRTKTGPTRYDSRHMVEASCHCGAVRIIVETAPTELTSCNCSICRRLGALWAFYLPGQVQVVGDTTSYLWADRIRGDRTVDIHHCATCACTTHWKPVGPRRDRMAVNARLMEPQVVEAARIRHLDGAETWKYLDEDGG